MKKLLLIGSTGQLGTDMQRTVPEGWTVAPVSHAQLEITDHAAARAAVESARPAVVLNAAAYHRTEDCEVHPDKAFAANALAPGNLADACAAIGARLVQFSSDYVFDGKKSSAYMETDPAVPLSVYGVSKLGGECLVRAASPRHIVVRTASLYGKAGSAGKGGNFVETMVARAKKGEPTEVVDDIIMSPTYTLDLAAAVWDLLKDDAVAEGGVYHIVNKGQASWFEFARKIFQLLGSNTPLKPVRSADRPSKIRRPAFSALGSERWPRMKVAPLRVWQDGLKAYLKEKGHIG